MTLIPGFRPRPWVRRGFQLSQLSGAVSRSVGPVSARRWAMKKLFTLGPQYHGHSQVGTVDEMFQEMIWGHITSLYIYNTVYIYYIIYILYIYICHTHIYIHRCISMGHGDMISSYHIDVSYIYHILSLTYHYGS